MTTDQPTPPAATHRFSRNDLIYYASLAALFAGLVLVYGLGWALIIVGGVGVLVSIATAFFLTSLTARIQGK